jgi:hypothetical protein
MATAKDQPAGFHDSVFRFDQPSNSPSSYLAIDLDGNAFSRGTARKTD